MRAGFTFVELMLVLGVIGLLLGIVFYAIDPGRRFAEGRDDARSADVRSLLQALFRYQAFNRGNLPVGIDADPATAQVIGTNTGGCDASCTATTTGAACLDLGAALVEEYLAEIPSDPATGSAGNTDYYVNKGADGRITVGACDPERTASIQVSR